MDDRPSVLVVDDEPVYCEVIQLVLEDYGLNVYTAHDVAEAEELMLRLRPSLLIVDIMMPNIDGLSYVRRLRGTPTYLTQPIFIASAKAMATDRQAALEAGASGFLAKPFSSKGLRSLIRGFLPLPTTGELRDKRQVGTARPSL